MITLVEQVLTDSYQMPPTNFIPPSLAVLYQHLKVICSNQKQS